MSARSMDFPTRKARPAEKGSARFGDGRERGDGSLLWFLCQEERGFAPGYVEERGLFQSAGEKGAFRSE